LYSLLQLQIQQLAQKQQLHVELAVLQALVEISSKERQLPAQRQRLGTIELLDQLVVCGVSTLTTAPELKCKSLIT
jgi:ABC-type uncharacterized transport system involved in gliding motility auxiliary subunit